MDQAHIQEKDMIVVNEHTVLASEFFVYTVEEDARDYWMISLTNLLSNKSR
jgi:hypothetical protein